MSLTVLSIATPVPLYSDFDYLPPAGTSDELLAKLQPGCRVSISFRNQTLTGFVLEVKNSSTFALDKLKPITEIIDQQSIFSPEIFSLCQWASNYYHYPLGLVLQQALPVLLRDGLPAQYKPQTGWQLTTHGKGLAEDTLKNARSQRALIELLRQQPQVSRAELDQHNIKPTTAKALADKGLIEKIDIAGAPHLPICSEPKQALTLNAEQQAALSQLLEYENNYHCFLLDGVTGSGKTEIYLQFIAHLVEQGKQALVIVPEIGLTPQTQQRFVERFNKPVLALHSGLNERQRLDAWLAANSGEAAIIIGTRSALFTPFNNLGAIIIDEEHDISLKQQDGFRFSARDAAIVRAHAANIPIVLGSATPSLETLHNAANGRSTKLELRQRATNAQLPEFHIVDIKHQALHAGIAEQSLQAIRQTLQHDEQALVFLNRRGFAPALRCHDCGWQAECNRCDARMTFHLQRRKLHCHHCDTIRPLPHACPSCNSKNLMTQGEGTEQIEQSLTKTFPNHPVIRIDSDTNTSPAAMAKLLQPVHDGTPCILVGTQMLAKGHHFAKLGLVVVANTDSGFFSADFRGPEKTAQLLMQVAGRAGREGNRDNPGKVLLQTHYPDSPQLELLLNSGYHALANEIMAERKLLSLPPFGYMAMVRAESTQANQIDDLLKEVKKVAQCGVQFTGPLTAPMGRKAGRFRAQLIVQSNNRKTLHQALTLTRNHLSQKKRIGHIRWSIDVDPQEMG